MLDFFKLVLYLTFFCVLCMFHGMPIHIIRDVALTIRSFYKRVRDFAQFRQATRDMNARYPDATAEEILREDVCIICRENMTVWQDPVGDADGNAPGGRQAVDERQRAKKLPCGHLLHFVCLRSWLERQQICPTCRTPVLSNTVTPTNQPQAPAPNPPVAAGPGQQPGGGPHVYTFGPFRLVLGARHGDGLAHNVAVAAANAPSSSHQRIPAPSSSANVQSQLNQIENFIVHEISTLNNLSDQLQVVRALQNELIRLRTVNGLQAASQSVLNQQHRHLQTQPALHTYRQASHGLDHHDLPTGLTLPPDWTLHPLQRIGSSTRPGAGFGNAFQTPQSDQQPSSRAQSVGATVVGSLSNQNTTSSSQLPAMQGSEASAHDEIPSASNMTDPHSKADVNDETHPATYPPKNAKPQPGPSTGDTDDTTTDISADRKTQSKGKGKAVTLDEEDDPASI